MSKLFEGKKFKLIIIFFIIFFLVLLFYKLNFLTRNNDISQILNTESYEYLPKEAKKYIEDVYLETGTILLTEKNKEENEPYLNPEYVEYLSYISGNTTIEDEKYTVIPSETIIDYVYGASLSDLNDDELPSSFDLRNVDGKNFVTPIKNQGSTGLCWTFATNAQAESYLLVKNNTSYEKGVSQIFSEVQIDYSTADNGIIDSSPLYSFNRILGDGGNFYYATTVMADNLSLVDVSWKKFEDYDYMPIEKNNVYKFSNSKYEVNGTVDYPKLNLSELDLTDSTNVETRNAYLNGLKKLIMENGGAYVGTVDPTSRCSISVNGYKLMYNDGKCASAGHAMQIIGWDDDFEYSFCSGMKDSKNYYYLGNSSTCENGTVISGKGAWLIKNSWGNSLPYVYLAYDSMSSTINLITDMDTKDWDNYYSLKTTGSSKITTTYEKETKVSEKLNKIKIHTGKQYIDYNVCVGKTTDTLNNCKSISTTYPGIYTIDFSSDNIVIDTDFVIQVTSNTSSGIDKMSLYTNNNDEIQEITTEDVYYENSLTNLDKYLFRISSKTINVAENSIVDYKILDENGSEITNFYSYSENIVFANQIFSKIEIENNIELGTYTLQTILNDKVMSESKIVIDKGIITTEGSGTEEDPYIINTPSQLNLVRLDRFAFYKLGQDIDLTYDTQNENGLFYNDGKGWEPIRYSNYSKSNAHYLYFSKGFSGGFDGNNHKITGLYINRKDEDGVGLFANVYNENYSNLHIKNLTLVNPNITGNSWVGSLLGVAYGTTYERLLNISNIEVIGGSVNGNEYVGGIIGLVNAGSYLTVYGTNIERHILSDLYNSATITANNYAGGIFGMIANISSYGADKSPIKIFNLLNKGNVTSNAFAGGFAGYIITRATNDISLSNSINTGIVLGKEHSSEIVGKFSDESEGNLNLTNLYYLNDDDLSFVSEKVNIDNVGKKELDDIKNYDSYSTWTPSFNESWKIETIDNITRMPVLKFMNFDYTSIDDIELDNSKKVNIYDLINPNIDAAKNIDYQIKDTSIATINEDGLFTGISEGETEVHIISYYDGYEKDVSLNVVKTKYTITFNSNGGTEVNVISNYAKEKIVEPDIPTREGYEFEGWYLDNETFTNKFEFNEMPEENIVLYAKWNKIKYTITFNSNGGTEVNVISNYAKEKIVEPDIPIREGYEFEGWYLDNETFTNKFEFNEMPEENIVLYAKWNKIKIKYTITFNSNGGTEVNEISNYAKEKITEPDIPIREGYEFEGWYLDNETFTNKFEFNEMTEENIVLYAKWNRLNIIINNYKVNDGYICDIPNSSSVSNYINNFIYDKNLTIKFYNYKNELISDTNAIIGTGSKISFYDGNTLIDEYINVVKSDVTGDGFVNLADLSKLYNHYRGNIAMNGFYLKAADVTNDGNVNLSDLAKLFNYYRGNIKEI